MANQKGGLPGRPTEYRAEFCQMLIKHMEGGLSFTAFAGIAGVSRQTLYEWLKAHPEFQDAKDRGEMRSLLAWEKMGQVLVAHGGGNGSAAIYCFNMKNRFGWRDQPKDEAPEDKRSEDSLTDEQLHARIAALLTKEKA